jgi:hypothetical protein
MKLRDCEDIELEEDCLLKCKGHDQIIRPGKRERLESGPDAWLVAAHF